MEMSVSRVEDFIMNLKLDSRNEKVREFLKSYNIPTFFDGDSEEEIKETKNAWAGYAYLMMLEKANGKELSEREELFYIRYYNYLLNTEPVGLEKELKRFYIKHRMTKDFYYNNEINETSVLEFLITIEAILSEMYDEKIKIVNSGLNHNTLYNGKNRQILVSNIESVFKNIANSNNFNEEMLMFVNHLCSVIEEYKLNEERKQGITKKALVYTVEDYLESKTLKNTRIGNLYRELYDNMIANKQIAIDSSIKAYEALKALQEKFNTVTYEGFDKVLKNYLVINANPPLKHYYSDALYFDTNDLEKDAFSKLFKMYVKGLKAMPKSKRTNVTKFFVINGNPITLMDMHAMEEKYYSRVKREKNEEKKKILEQEAQQVSELISFIKSQSESYKMEEHLMKIVECQNECSELIDLAYDNLNEFEDLGNRLVASYATLDQLASSSSASKVTTIRKKRRLLSSMILVHNNIYEEISTSIEKNGANTIDFDKDIIIEEVKNKDKTIALLQELTGRGIITLEEMLDESIEGKKPIMKNLTPGYKIFVEKALKFKGVSKFYKN